ncbi:retrotransposon gag protein, putative [Medicago truncatula]|uniref:Retrotransposon gag protein, putative n=1 Tax=Medicago truncatula TaxID=3880 RepID=A0A072THJ2_MEDTR|nr:retrotransposon gag protein, putative [Medicago truncatula]
MSQNKQLQELKNQTGLLNDSLSKLNTKVDSIATHTKILETQISQVATSSQTPRVFPGQTEANPKAHVNAISFGGSKLEETVAKVKNTKGESVKLLGEKDVIESEKLHDKNKAPSLLRFVKLNLEAQFNKFVNILKKICIKIPFAEVLSRMPQYNNFLKEIFSKKKAMEHNETIALTRESSAIIKKPPPKLRDLGSFFIPCVIGSETLDKALCDLGSSVSLLALSLFKKTGIGELKPTETTLKLVDRTTIQLVGYVEDIPV